MPKDKFKTKDEVVVKLEATVPETEISEESFGKPLTTPEVNDTLSSDDTATKESSPTGEVKVCQCAIGSYADDLQPKWVKNEVRSVSKEESERLLAIRRFNRNVFKLA